MKNGRVNFLFYVPLLFLLACQTVGDHTSSADRYLSYSRMTDPKDQTRLLENLPDSVAGICRVAKNQTVHHNLLGYFDIPNAQTLQMQRVWPPRMPDMLQTLEKTDSSGLSGERKPEDRLISACILESHLLAGMLRYKGIPVRIRVGYFKNINTDREHILGFWEDALSTRRIMANLLDKDPQEWKSSVDKFVNKQVDVDHQIEHWACEYWDRSAGKWKLLDANNTFLKAHSKIDMDFELDKKHFEYAYEAWKKMRTATDFNPDQYAEEPQDGRSHIRSQLLWDFYSLLNHDISGYNKFTENAGEDSVVEMTALEFIKRKKYEDVTEEEFAELDALAELLAQNPSVDQLKEFYYKSKTLRLQNAERDSYSFVYKQE